MILNGRVGQVLGPFAENVDLLDNNQAIGSLTPEQTKPVLYKLGIQTEPGTTVLINGISIIVGKTGIYELDQVVNVKSLVFPEGASEDTIVDFVY